MQICYILYDVLMCFLNFLLDKDKDIFDNLGLPFLPPSILKKIHVATIILLFSKLLFQLIENLINNVIISEGVP